ncbi:hypothetical protein IV203_020009 [Nitzschia inconspicua]|uniref:Uncharacterized protein n=1 Tax=Nitzschia inconspicua TaxID=303405 RepID=A0A9K3M0C1_9STRA|nr:hypothetical protein IV203_020009 [Nitzschia inconspicua]
MVDHRSKRTRKSGRVVLPLLLCLIVSTTISSVSGWTGPIRNRRDVLSTSRYRSNGSSAAGTASVCVNFRRPYPPSKPSTTALYGIFDFLNPYDSKIPPDLVEEIYRAEANTEAAKDRGTRIFVYTLLAILGIGLASFNGFLTEVRVNGLPEGTDAVVVVPPPTGDTLDILVQAGFGWVLENPLYKFLFTNKIGGALCLLFGGGSALLAEAEFDSKRINAEKIYEELERRRRQQQRTPTKTRPTTTAKSTTTTTKKKRQSGKEKKSLKALSEVIDTTNEASKEQEGTTSTAMPEKNDNLTTEMGNSGDGSGGGGGGGVFDKMKELYEKADSMAASQALLLNKQLEDAGVVEKITDETGLKVIGREKAKELANNQDQDKDQTKQNSER